MPLLERTVNRARTTACIEGVFSSRMNRRAAAARPRMTNIFSGRPDGKDGRMQAKFERAALGRGDFLRNDLFIHVSLDDLVVQAIQGQFKPV